MEDTPQEIIEERHNSSRRDFLKKSAVTGAVVWSAPAISTLSSRAWADENGYEEPCECDEAAYALFVEADGIIIIPERYEPSIVTQEGESDFVAGVDLGLVEATLLNAGIPDNCHAHADVASVKVDLGVLGILGLDGVIEATVLTADAFGDGCEARSSIATLTVGGEEVLDLETPNLDVDVDLGPLVNATLVLNEQTGGTNNIAVNALHLNLTVLGALGNAVQTLELIVSHAESTCCPQAA